MLTENIAAAFGLQPYEKVEPIATGLINYNYKVSKEKGSAFFLQKINTKVFKNPLHLQQNYEQIQNHLSLKGSFRLPQIVYTTKGDLFYEADKEAWRCFEFVRDSYSPSIAHTAEQAYTVANCFAKFTSDLVGLPSSRLHIILPDFHNLTFRFQQFETALKQASYERKEEVADLINEVSSKTYLLNWYHSIVMNQQAYPLRIMHHDCKISNILFQKETNSIVCPIDLDTTQPGYFFSDMGDMIRSMVPNVSENDASAHLDIRTDFYEAIVSGYKDKMAILLTKNELADLHLAGPVLVLMQAIRFLADYLNNNSYYHINYPTQNKDRAINQMKLLALLEKYLQLHS